MDVTTRQAAEVLGISPNSVKKLIAAQVLPEVHHRGVRATLPLGDVQTLAGRLWIGPDELGLDALPVLRVDAAEREEGERCGTWKGYSARLTACEQLEALRAWWQGDPDKICSAGFLPVTVSGFVVAVLAQIKPADSIRMIGRAGRAEVRHRFTCSLGGRVADLVSLRVNVAPTLPSAQASTVEKLLGNRIAAVSGGPIAYARSGESKGAGE